jgi:hypothetical protein
VPSGKKLLAVVKKKKLPEGVRGTLCAKPQDSQQKTFEVYFGQILNDAP